MLNPPLIQITIDHMRHTMVHAFTEQILGMDQMFQTAIAEACQPENVQRILTEAAQRVLRETVAKEVEAYFGYGEGRKQVQSVVSRALARNATPADPTVEQLRYLVACFASEEDTQEALDRFDAFERGEVDPRHVPDMGPELEPAGLSDYGKAYLKIKGEGHGR